MAVPKRKTSRQRRDTRRATHALEGPSVSECPQCHSPKLSHRVCPTCGMYNGRQVIKVEE
jgi:large subunit ribosomal protein L32